jgi:hypothetical protein
MSYLPRLQELPFLIMEVLNMRDELKKVSEYFEERRQKNAEDLIIYLLGRIIALENVIEDERD